ncbi:MAG TPA: staygreen family protein [Anaerolineae bacterium]|nr:staygreen family protein [Anaerolineae bacterium]
MSRLRPDKLHVEFGPGAGPDGPTSPRRYTLTHSDRTGDLYLTIAAEYNGDQVSGLYTLFMRDEVLAEWLDDAGGLALHVYCHVSGGLALGPAGWRFAIFQRELPLVLEAFRHGDRLLYEAHPELDAAPIRVHFAARQRRYRGLQRWGTPGDYR